MTLYRDHIDVLRAPLVDTDYGQARDWDNAQVVYASLRASVQPDKSHGRPPDESQDRETGITYLRVYTPGQADIQASDRVRYQGLVYDVVGVAHVWPPISRAAYTSCTMRRIDG